MQHTVSIVCRMSCICVERHTFMNFRECMQPLMMSWGLFAIDCWDRKPAVWIISTVNQLPSKIYAFHKARSFIVSKRIRQQGGFYSHCSKKTCMIKVWNSAHHVHQNEQCHCCRLHLRMWSMPTCYVSILTKWTEIILNPTDRNWCISQKENDSPHLADNRRLVLLITEDTPGTLYIAVLIEK